jgi:hypothetical protein
LGLKNALSMRKYNQSFSFYPYRIDNNSHPSFSYPLLHVRPDPNHELLGKALELFNQDVFCETIYVFSYIRD